MAKVYIDTWGHLGLSVSEYIDCPIQISKGGGYSITLHLGAWNIGAAKYRGTPTWGHSKESL